MENEHISIEEMEEVAYFSGRLDSEEGKKFQEKAGRLNSHILRCEDCLNKYREIMEKADKEKAMSHKKNGVKRLYDEIFNEEEIEENSLMSEIGEYIPDVETKTIEELAEALIQLEDESLDKVFWVKTVERDNPNFSPEKMPILDNPISQREILLSKLIGKPYPTYFLDGVMDDKHDKYRNEVRKPRTEDEIETLGKYAYDLETNQSIAREEDCGGVDIDVKEVLEFGYDRSGDKKPGSIEVSVRDLWRAGLSNKRMGIADPQLSKTKISSRDIADADKETSLTKTEVRGIRKLINKIREFFKGKGEK